MMHLCYDERGEDLLHGCADHEKEMLKRVILEHEVEYKGQVHELHRLWRVQRDLMLEYERNPLQRNSSSSQIPTNQHSTNENNSVFDSNQNRPSFEFVREGSAQSSANIAPAKKPMFDLQLPASEYNGHENGLESRFGLANSTVSSFGKGVAISSANMAGTSRNGRNLVSDLNEPVKDIMGFDFLGVNRDPVWHRRADKGSSSGLFCANRNIGNEELAREDEKGRNSSGVHFFNRDKNHPNLTSSNSLGMNFFSTYGGHQNPVKDQHAIAPQLFGQKLTFSFDPHQVHSTNISRSNNSNYNNLVSHVSFPVLDSSPHCNNLNKNEGLMEGSVHPLNPFFSNGSGAPIGGSVGNSGHFSNAHHNLVFGSSGGQSWDFAKSNWTKGFTLSMNLDLNEPVPEGNQDAKAIKLFGSTCGGPVSEANCLKNEINLNNIASEDELSQKASSSASVIVGEHSMKLFGIPFFGNPSSSNIKSTLHADDESNRSEKRVDPEDVGPAKLALIDLNEDLPLENEPSSSMERNEGKIARYVIDLEMPASQFDEPGIDRQQQEIEMKRASGPDLSIVEAANTIIVISQLEINPEPSSPQPDALLQFADLVVSGCDKQASGPESDSEDLFESMTLKLEEVKSDDRFGTGNFCEKKIEGESSSQAGETGYTSLLFTRGRRGPARKRRQRRDFQRDVLPTIASLSRVEVTEDLQIIGDLMRACGQEFESALTKRVGRSSSNAKGKRQQRSPQMNTPVRTPQVKQPDRHLPQTALPQGNLPEANLPLRTPQVNTTQNPHVNSPQRIQKASQPQRIPPVVMNQQPRAPLVNQAHGRTLMGPPHKVSLEYQQPRTIQPNQPQKITLVNQAHRYTAFNQRQKAPINSSQNMPPIHQQHGGTGVSHSDVVPGTNWVQRSVQTNQAQRSVSASQSQTSVQASDLQRIPVANSQQAVNQNADMEGDGLSVIGWGRTTTRRNRRPRGPPLAPQQQHPGNNNPAVPLK